jgi:hypothetical protein
VIHVANSVAGCGVMIDIMCIVTGNACVFGYVVSFMSCGASMFGDVVGIMTGRPGVSAWAVIAGRSTVFRHATMIIAAIMSVRRGSSRIAVAAVIVIAGGATTVAAVGTVIATGVASRGSGTATIAVSAAGAVAAAIAIASTAAVAAASTAIPTAAAVASATAVSTTTTMVSHGTLDMPGVRSAIEPPGSRGHRQSTCTYREDEQQRTPAPVRH